MIQPDSNHSELPKAEVLNERRLLHTEEIDDIITTPPKWLLRSGIGAFGLILMLLISLSCLIHFPQIIKVQFKLDSAAPPMLVASKESGNLTDLFVRDNEKVKKGQVLGYIESVADRKDVLQLFEQCKKLQYRISASTDVPVIKFPEKLHLGELQGAFDMFSRSYAAYFSHAGHKIEKREAVLKSTKNIIDEIEIWKGKYILTAPQAGEISFESFIQVGQFIHSGRDLFMVYPSGLSPFGLFNIAEVNIGKIRVGQSTILKFNNYPYLEYGTIKGEINYISKFQVRDSLYLGRVNLNSEKMTDIKRPIDLRPGMKGTMEVIVQNETLFERLTENFRKL